MQIHLQSTQLKIAINSLGAELCSIKNINSIEFIWQASPSVWPRHAPVLFPIVGKLKDDFFCYNNKKHELSQHGFARDLDFELKEADADSCTFELKQTNKTKINFPFDFTFQIKYLLLENTLVTKYAVFNPSNEPIFFSVGAHPGFNCPLLPNETFEDYYLEFEKEEFSQTLLNNGLRFDTKKSLIFPNKKLSLNKELFSNDALVFENKQVNCISLCSSKSNHKITLKCTNWPYFGIWSKKGSGEFVCLEPWYGVADSHHSNNEVTKKEGIIELASQTEFVCDFALIFT